MCIQSGSWTSKKNTLRKQMCKMFWFWSCIGKGIKRYVLARIWNFARGLWFPEFKVNNKMKYFIWDMKKSHEQRGDHTSALLFFWLEEDYSFKSVNIWSLLVENNAICLDLMVVWVHICWVNGARKWMACNKEIK